MKNPKKKKAEKSKGIKHYIETHSEEIIPFTFNMKVSNFWNNIYPKIFKNEKNKNSLD